MEQNAPSTERFLEEVRESLCAAKLQEFNLLPTSQALCFTSTNYLNHNLKFLELNKQLLQDIKEGQHMYIKGDAEENAVLCTDTHTYDMSLTQTSNSLLLVKDMQFKNCLDGEGNEENRNISKVIVSSVFYDFLEVTSSKPHLTKLNHLLKKTLYRGPEQEYLINREDLLSYEDLENIIQSSAEELKKMLDLMPVAKIEDKIRLLDFEYHFRVLSYMLKLIDENSWGLDEIDYEQTIASLSDLVPASVLNAVFDFYAEETKVIDGLQLYCYRESAVCICFAQVLLHSVGKFNLDEFLQAWRESVPEGMVVSEDMLNGIAIVDRKLTPKVIWAFPEEDLPESIVDRFRILFEAKEKWTVPEIGPYIRRLTTDKTDVNALLAKYTRVSTIQGIKYYSSKHGK